MFISFFSAFTFLLIHFCQGTPKYLHVYGDSLSDTGNTLDFTGKLWPTHPSGRFSDDKVWPEYLADLIGAELSCLALGGATLSNEIVQGYTGMNMDIPVDDVMRQFERDEYLSTDGTHLFIISIGVNDVFYSIYSNTHIDVDEWAYKVELLTKKINSDCERQKLSCEILFLGVMPLHISPLVNNLKWSRALVQRKVQTLDEKLQSIAKNSNRVVRYFSLTSLINHLNTVQNIWFDSCHFTSVVHGKMALEIWRFIETRNIE
jgi:hypothetical protein